MAVTYSSGNYHSIADTAGMTLPDGDWTWLGVIQPGSDITTGQDIFSNGVWGTGSTFNFYITGGSIAVQIASGSLNQDLTVTASDWVAIMIKRDSGTLTIHKCLMGSSSVTSSAGVAITGSFNTAGGFHFGRRQDTGANPFLGDVSDGIFIPGVALSTTDLSDLATGTAMDSTSWWASREFHGIFSTASTENDQTDTHLITKSGTPPEVSDPAELVRFGASEWTAAGAGATSFIGDATGEMLAARYAVGKYQSIPDAAGMTLPNTDWSWLLAIKAADVTTVQDILINGVYQAANTLNLYINNGFFVVDISNLGPDEGIAAVADTWYLLAIVRNSGTFTLRSVPFGSGTVSNSGAGTAISAAYDSGTGYKFGVNTDLSSFPSLDVDVSDAIFIPGTAVSDSDLADIAQGTALSSFSWWGSREFHLVAADAEDITGNHTVTNTGALDLLAGPAELVRFGESLLTAEGAGVASFAGSSKNATDLAATGAGVFTGLSNKLLATELTASGVGAASLDFGIRYQSDLTAAGVGGSALVGDIDGTTFSMAGTGAASFNVELTAQTDLAAAGAGLTDFQARTAAELDASGAGVALFDVGILAASDLTGAGVGVANFEPVPGTTLAADGVGVATLNSQHIAAADFSAAGVGSADFRGKTLADLNAAGTSTFNFLTRSLITPRTQAGADMFIIAANAVQTASLSATTTASGFDVNNIANDFKSSGWRSTATTAQTITFTWGSGQTVSGLGIGFSNLMAGSTVQLKVYTLVGDGSPVYDTGALDVSFSYDAPKGFSTIGLTSYAFGGGSYFSTLFATQTLEKAELIVTSAGNPDGYIEISNVVLGNAFTPERGASFGAQISQEDNTSSVRSDGGDPIIDRGTKNKLITFNLGSLTQTDKQVLDGITRRNGTSDPVFLSAHQNDNSAEGVVSYTILGRFKESPSIINFSYELHSSQIQITEI